MRSLLVFIFALLVAGGSLRAQEQERTLEQRVLKPDTNRAYNYQQSSYGKRSYGTKSAYSKEFYSDKKFRPTEYETREFSAKKSWFASLKFWTKEGNTKGKYQIPNAGKSAGTKTMPVEDAREASKTAATRELRDGDRSYLGAERAKLNTAVDPNKLPRITNQLTEIKTIDDVRELLNKNK